MCAAKTSRNRSFLSRSELTRRSKRCDRHVSGQRRSGRVAQLVSGTYVPRARHIRGLRDGSGMAHLLGW